MEETGMGEDVVKKRKIVIADDNRYVNDSIMEVLGDYGFQVIQAFDGLEALKAFEEEMPDLVFLDYRMPGKDGMDVLKEIKAKDPNAPVVFITGEGSEDVAVQAMKAGADDYISKPISMPEMVQLANKLIRDHEILMETLRLRDRGDAYKDFLVTITEAIGEAVVTVDSEGYIQFMNPMAKELWGNDAELKGQFVGVLFDDPGDDILGDIKSSLEQGMERFEREHLFKRIDGSTFAGLVTLSPLKQGKYKGGIVIVVRDLSQVEEMRRQIINAEKLASLGNVVEGVAHEIRNSLTSLGGFTRRLERLIEPGTHQKIYLEYIIGDVERLEKMVSDIEEYANYAKIHKLSFSKVSIEDVIDEALIQTFSKQDLTGIQYEVDIPSELEEINADRNSLIEAFWHLFVNACEAMEGSGTLTISVSINQKFIIVNVIDTGRGIPADEIHDIFNPFYTSKVYGAGTGLSKVYMIIEEHHGFITVNSTEGKGTHMRICLPKKLIVKSDREKTLQ